MPPPPPRFHGGNRFVAPRAESLPTHDAGRYKVKMVGSIPAWKDVLKRCGYPTACLVVDFETYFDDEYKMQRGSGDGLSTVEYIKDSRFEILGCAFTLVHDNVNFPDYEGGATRFILHEEGVARHLTWLKSQFGERLENITVIIQNAKFDASVLAHRLGLYPRFVVDVLGLARAWNARSKHGLGELAPKFGLPEKGDTEEFRGVTFKQRYIKPKKGRSKAPKLPTPAPIADDDQVYRLSEYACNDAMREWELFTVLLPMLSRPEVELRLMQHTLELQTRSRVGVDFAKGDEIAAEMGAEVDRVLSKVHVVSAEHGNDLIPVPREMISGDKSFEEMLSHALWQCGDDVAKYQKPGKLKMLLAIAKDDPERKVLENHPDERVRNLMAARVALDSWPNHIKRVQRIMRMARACDGVLPVPLKYHGAHTGRWSGDEKINLQNLGSRGHELISRIREMLIALSGDTFAIVDLAAIEARILAWIAGQKDLVERFAKDEEVYCGFATKVLGYNVRKPKKEGAPGYIKAIEDKHKWARNAIGKIGILGCGYGMGTDRIFEYADGAIDIETADKIKVTYRAEHPAIVQFWKDIERAFLYTAKYGKSCEMPRGLRFDQTDDYDVIITLPSGRELHYHKVRIVSHDRGETIEVWNGKEHHWEHTWGGTLTENVVQAIARDLLAEAMLRLEDRGYHTALHVHDELIMAVPESRGASALEAGIEEMRRRPAWGADLPLNAEGLVNTRYGGH